jgi:hypothetical protein
VTPTPKKGIGKALLAAGCVAAIATSAVCIYFYQFAKPGINLPLHQEIGRVLAAETAKLLTNKGKVVVIALDEQKFPELKAQLKSFESALGRTGVSIKETYMLETESKSKYGTGSGLSARRYLRIVNKNQSADAIVSFVGVPDLSDGDIKELKKVPKFVAETRSADDLPNLFQKKVLHVAVASRFTFPAPIEGKPRNSRQWFDKYFQVVTTEMAKELFKAND